MKPAGARLATHTVSINRSTDTYRKRRQWKVPDDLMGTVPRAPNLPTAATDTDNRRRQPATLPPLRIGHNLRAATTVRMCSAAPSTDRNSSSDTFPGERVRNQFEK